MKILVTGVNGMLGSALIEQLSNSDHHIWATGKGTCRLSLNLLHDGCIYYNLDITDQSAVNHLVSQFSPDLIIHAAAMTQVDDCELNKSLCYSVNIDGTKHLIQAAQEIDARFCLISTDFVFDGSSGPYRETDPTSAVNYYGETKAFAEQLVISSGLSWTIARTVLLYGRADPSKRSNFIYWVKQQLEAGKPIKVVNDQIRTPTYIPDLVTGIMLIAEKGATGIFHLSGEEVYTPYQMAMIVAEHLRLETRLIEPVDASTFTQIGKRPLRTGFYLDKAINELGYHPTGFKNALSQIF